MQPIKIGRVVWPGRVGIGAGLVKNGAMLLDYCARASSIEIGSITRYLQEGNSGRTVWKYPVEAALRHNAGMPNFGVENLITDLTAVQDKLTVPWGFNVAVTPGIIDNQTAALDIRETIHLLLFSGIEPDWITLNVASPDTADSIDMLSTPDRVQNLIEAMKTETKAFDDPPLWLKIGPGMNNQRLTDLATVAINSGIEALVCGNTLPDPQGGGWCGERVKASANAALWYLKQVVGDQLPLIGVGGVVTGKDVAHKLALGATAVQVVSATLLRGRDAARDIEAELPLASM